METKIDLSNNEITFVGIYRREWFHPSYEPYSSINVSLDNNPFNCNCGLENFVKFLKNRLRSYGYPDVYIPAYKLRCHTPKSLKDRLIFSIYEDLLECDPEYETLSFSNDMGYNCTLNRRGMDSEESISLFDCSNLGLKDIPLSLNDNPKSDYNVLKLSGNLLRNVDKLPKISGRLTDLDLSHNNITEFNVLIIKNNQDLFSIKLNRKQNVTCASGTVMEMLDESKLCNENITGVAMIPSQQSTKAQSVLLLFTFTGIVIAVVVVTIVGTSLYWRYQTAIQVYCYSSGWKILQWLVPHPDYNTTRTYDAFISYANEDETFVVEELVPFLEDGENKFKLCLHYRDWIPGDFIPDQILRSVLSSQRTIVVLSPNFLKSVWGVLEFITAHTEALKDGKSRVIVIVYQDVDLCQDLDKDLKAYIKMNTYLKWGSRWFWKQLIFALRSPPQKLLNTRQ